MTLVESPSAGVCSICQCALSPGEALRRCDVCRASFHAECWEHNDGCGTYRCSQAPAPLKTVVSGSGDGAWGDVKRCPACGEQIDSKALSCKHCKAKFETRSPMTPTEYQALLRRNADARRAMWLAIALFVVSACGWAAPATLPLAGVWLYSQRRTFRKPADAGRLLVYGSAAISTAYLALMLAVFVFEW